MKRDPHPTESIVSRRLFRFLIDRSISTGDYLAWFGRKHLKLSINSCLVAQTLYHHQFKLLIESNQPVPTPLLFLIPAAALRRVSLSLSLSLSSCLLPSDRPGGKRGHVFTCTSSSVRVSWSAIGDSNAREASVSKGARWPNNVVAGSGIGTARLTARDSARTLSELALALAARSSARSAPFLRSTTHRVAFARGSIGARRPIRPIHGIVSFLYSEFDLARDRPTHATL